MQLFYHELIREYPFSAKDSGVTRVAKTVDFANDLTRLDSICRDERAPIAIKLHPAQRVPAGTPVDHQ